MSSGLEAAGSDTDIFMVNGILGELVTFPLNIQQSQKVISISWNSKTSVAFVTPGNSGAAPTISITHQNYHKRINVSGQNYNLELRNLRLEDSGIYKADINVKTSEKITTTTRCYNLQVYRKLWEDRGLDFLFLLCNLLSKEHFYFWQLGSLNLFILINTYINISVLKGMWLCLLLAMYSSCGPCFFFL